MHTYRPSPEGGKFGFRVCTTNGDPKGPHFEEEAEAAAFCAFLNGGKYEPAAVEPLMKPAAEARAKTQKERAAAAKAEEEAEKARQLREHPPAPLTQPVTSVEAEDEDEPEEKTKAQRRPQAHAAKAKLHVKQLRPSKPVSIRKHK